MDRILSQAIWLNDDHYTECSPRFGEILVREILLSTLHKLQLPTLGQNNGYSERRTDRYQQLLAHILLALAFLGSWSPQRLDTHIEGCFALSIPSRLLANACYCFTIRHGIILDSIFFTRQYHFLLWVIDRGNRGENIISTALHGKRVSERRTKACAHNCAVEEQSSRRVSLCEHCIDRSLHFGRCVSMQRFDCFAPRTWRRRRVHFDGRRGREKGEEKVTLAIA